MCADVVAGVGELVESAVTDRPGVERERPIHVRMLGPLAIRRDGLELALPASRKVRGLLAWLLNAID